MPRSTLKLVAVAAILSVGPVAASQGATAKSALHHWNCPKKRAQAAAASAWHTPQRAGSAARVTISDRLPLDRSLFDLGRRGLITP